MAKKTANIKDKNNKEIGENQVVIYRGHRFDVVFCNGAFKLMECKSMLDGACDFWLHNIVGVYCRCGKKIESLEIL